MARDKLHEQPVMPHQALARTAQVTRTGFRNDERGVIAILFALLLVPLVGITFAAIDYGRASRIQQVVAKAADAAVFTAATRLMEGESAVRTAFDASFRTNLPDDLEKVPYRLDVASNGKSLSVELDLRIKTSLVSILGVNKIDIKVTATASRPKPKLPAAPAILDPDGDQISKRDLNDAINRSLEAFGGRSPGRAPDEEAVRQRIREIERQLRLIGSHLR